MAQFRVRVTSSKELGSKKLGNEYYMVLGQLVEGASEHSAIVPEDKAKESLIRIPLKSKTTIEIGTEYLFTVSFAPEPPPEE